MPEAAQGRHGPERVLIDKSPGWTASAEDEGAASAMTGRSDALSAVQDG